MNPFVNELWTLCSDALRLDPTVFTRVTESDYPTLIPLTVLLLAGLSQAIGQSIALFINRVRPIRFALSLLVSAVLYVFSYLFWVSSIWIVSNLIYGVDLTLPHVARGLALCYVAQILGILMVLPYFGVPISVGLSIWTFLAILVGLESVQGLTMWSAMGCAGLGWVVLQVLQRTVGRPLGIVSRWIRNQLAGTRLVTDPKALREIVLAENVFSQPLPVTEWMQEASNRFTFLTTRRFIMIVFIALFGVFILMAMAEANGLFEAAVMAFQDTFGLVMTLIMVTVIALLIAILMTPNEALTWWANWKEPEILSLGEVVRQPAESTVPVSRYVAFLDGIDQGSYEYSPAVEGFLDKLGHELPNDIMVLKGIVSYSVTNKPLSQHRVLAFLWRAVEKLRANKHFGFLANLINMRNLFAVLVSADNRYGPIQNQGLAQVLYNSLLHHGYEPGSGVPITLIGSSGGSQMAAGALPFLKRATGAPIEVISIAGVIGGNTGVMDAEHIYHLAGEKDKISPLGKYLSPARWPVAVLSNWNRAMRRGRITYYSLGEVTHNGPEGPYSHTATYEDGRSHLERTLAIVRGIILKDWNLAGFDPDTPNRLSNYDLYQASSRTREQNFALEHPIPAEHFVSQGEWIGRLILPNKELRDGTVWLELYHTPEKYRPLRGSIIKLGWKEDPSVQRYVERTTKDVEFPPHYRVGKKKGLVLPERLNHLEDVNPLESIAGAHRLDDVLVRLPEPVEVIEDDTPEHDRLLIGADPVHISGRYKTLLRFLGTDNGEDFEVQHYNKETGEFDGPEDLVTLPWVIPDNRGVAPSVSLGLEKSPFNKEGWYAYGSTNCSGGFEVHSLAPVRYFEPRADAVIRGESDCLHFINYDYWKSAEKAKSTLKRTLLLPRDKQRKGPAPEDFWKEGERALVLHQFGGIGGKNGEFAPLGVYFGHFSFGVATVVRDSLTDKLRFQIEYRQVYTHNPTGTIAGSNDWSRYMGDRQYGWSGCRPTTDILVKYPPLMDDYDFDGVQFSPLKWLIRELDVMCARYRIGDGAGLTYRNIINSCVQDSCQALYASLNRMLAEYQSLQNSRWMDKNPGHEQTLRFRELTALVESLQENLEPFGMVRPDWESDQPTLGRFAEETPKQTLIYALTSWRSVLPRLTNDVLAMIFLKLGASLWVIQASQLGGVNEDIEPIIPTDFGFFVPKVKRPSEPETR